MNDLVEWLRARLDEDEALARRCRGERWEREGTEWVFGVPSADTIWFDHSYPHVGDHIARWDPARVLAEVEAKRSLLAAYDEARAYYSANRSAPAGEVHGLWTAVKFSALPYADQPGYRDEWRPS